VRDEVLRATSIIVLLSVIAPSFLVLNNFWQTAESSLPACCRRDGQHHCAMMEMASAPSDDLAIGAVPASCPFRSQAILTQHSAAYIPEASSAYFAGLISHPAIHAQTHAQLRIAEARSHQKRGPPASVVS
jgi:hypothetical protein